MLEHIDFLAGAIADCDAAIEELLRPFVLMIEQLDAIPGVDVRSAQDIIAEVGTDMSAFPTHKHLCSWAGICPGNNQSGGKRQRGKIRKSNKWLKAALIRCAHAVAKTKDTYLGAQFRRFAGRKGTQRAAVVVTHTILESIYFILRDGVDYQEMGPAYFDQINKEHIVRQYKKRLEALGLVVEIQQPPAAA